MNYVIQILISIITSTIVYFMLFSGVTKNTDKIVNEPQKQNIVNLDNFGLKDLENEIINTVETVKESVVSIVISKDFILYDGGRASGLVQQQVGGGSGILVSDEGYVLTNKHVVNDLESSYTIVFSNGESVESKNIWLDENLDIAVVSFDKKAVGTREPAEIADLSISTRVGQLVLAIGNALAEFQNSVTFGVISGNNRKLLLDDENNYAGLLQTDTAISEGNSGGPLFNLDGEVIAINTAVSAFGENIGFAIPISEEFVKATLNSIRTYGSIKRPFMGVRYVDMNINLAREIGSSSDSGIFVSEIMDGSPAQEAGIVAKDIITKVNGMTIDQQHSFLYYLFTKVPGEMVSFEVIRNGKTINIEVKVGTNTT